MNYQIPYDFVIRALYPFRPTIKKMLGGYGIYNKKKIVLFLRDRNVDLEFNGIFVATIPEFFAELQKEIHTSQMKDFDLDGSRDSWIFISEDLLDFEQKVTTACELIKKGDERIGK
jgi:hypothetical protein